MVNTRTKNCKKVFPPSWRSFSIFSSLFRFFRAEDLAEMEPHFLPGHGLWWYSDGGCQVACFVFVFGVPKYPEHDVQPVKCSQTHKPVNFMHVGSSTWFLPYTRLISQFELVPCLFVILDDGDDVMTVIVGDELVVCSVLTVGFAVGVFAFLADGSLLPPVR